MTFFALLNLIFWTKNHTEPVGVVGLDEILSPNGAQNLQHVGVVLEERPGQRVVQLLGQVVVQRGGHGHNSRPQKAPRLRLLPQFRHQILFTRR